MREILISAENVSKKFAKTFKLGSNEGIRKTLRGLLGFSYSKTELHQGEFFALNDVSFEIRRGECVGLIGNNGAGKSTLLKHIGGIYIPDSGSIKVRGHVEGLIELGAGFHPLLSGRENILQRVSVLNVSKSEEKRIVNEIIEFSELEEFIDMPLKNYSSGMQARLGFASAVLSKPDVLLIDEVLSVGDFTFRQKCLSKINEIRKDAAIIFVSHSDQSMRLFCDRGILMGKGKIEYDGSIDEALNYYFAKYSPEKKDASLKATVGEEFFNDEKVEFVEGQWISANGKPTDCFSPQEKMVLNIRIKFKQRVKFHNLIVGVPFYREKIYLGALSNEYVNHKFQVVDDFLEANFEIDSSFNRGSIDSLITLYDGPECLVRKPLNRINVLNNNSRIHGEFLINFKINQVTQ